jgi:hypothetical protein
LLDHLRQLVGAIAEADDGDDLFVVWLRAGAGTSSSNLSALPSRYA